MSIPSKPIRLRPGLSQIFINPEGSQRHAAPVVPMWKLVAKPDPRDKEERLPYYAVFNAPYSTLINGGEGVRFYLDRGWSLFTKFVWLGRVFQGRTPDPTYDFRGTIFQDRYSREKLDKLTWEDINNECNIIATKARKRIDHGVEAQKDLVAYIKLLVGKRNYSEDDEHIKLLRRDIELREEDLKERKLNNESEQKTFQSKSKSAPRPGTSSEVKKA